MAELTETEQVIEVGRLAGEQLRPVAIISVATGIVVGFGIGSFMTKRRLLARYEAQLNEELEELREHYREKQQALADQPKPDPEAIIAANGYVSTVDAVEEIPQVDNLFEEHEEPATPEWSFEDEEAKRDPSKPYIIHVDEFHNERPDEHGEMTVTWYEGDDVLCDERDIPVDDMDELVGLENLEKMGHGSGDPNVVYIRNRQRHLDIEVTRSNGTFAEEVAGQPPEEDPEIRHSSDRRSRHEDD